MRAGFKSFRRSTVSVGVARDAACFASCSSMVLLSVSTIFNDMRGDDILSGRSVSEIAQVGDGVRRQKLPYGLCRESEYSYSW